MSALEFIAGIAWPVAVLGIAVMFRKPITEALTSGTGRLRAGPFELEWKEKIAEVEADLGRDPSISKGQIGGAAGRLDEVAEIAPAAAVVEAFGQVEAALRKLLESNGIQQRHQGGGVRQLAEQARSHRLITPETEQAIAGLAVLRDLAAHGEADDLSPQRAHEFVALTHAVLYALTESQQPSSDRA